jgi:hypothetical protein
MLKKGSNLAALIKTDALLVRVDNEYSRRQKHSAPNKYSISVVFLKCKAPNKIFFTYLLALG